MLTKVSTSFREQISDTDNEPIYFLLSTLGYKVGSQTDITLSENVLLNEEYIVEQKKHFINGLELFLSSENNLIEGLKNKNKAFHSLDKNNIPQLLSEEIYNIFTGKLKEVLQEIISFIRELLKIKDLLPKETQVLLEKLESTNITDNKKIDISFILRILASLRKYKSNIIKDFIRNIFYIYILQDYKNWEILSKNKNFLTLQTNSFFDKALVKSVNEEVCMHITNRKKKLKSLIGLYLTLYNFKLTTFSYTKLYLEVVENYFGRKISEKKCKSFIDSEVFKQLLNATKDNISFRKELGKLVLTRLDLFIGVEKIKFQKLFEYLLSLENNATKFESVKSFLEGLENRKKFSEELLLFVFKNDLEVLYNSSNYKLLDFIQKKSEETNDLLKLSQEQIIYIERLPSLSINVIGGIKQAVDLLTENPHSYEAKIQKKLEAAKQESAQANSNQEKKHSNLEQKLKTQKQSRNWEYYQEQLEEQKFSKDEIESFKSIYLDGNEKEIEKDKKLQSIFDMLVKIGGLLKKDRDIFIKFIQNLFLEENRILNKRELEFFYRFIILSQKYDIYQFKEGVNAFKKNDNIEILHNRLNQMFSILKKYINNISKRIRNFAIIFLKTGNKQILKRLMGVKNTSKSAKNDNIFVSLPANKIEQILLEHGFEKRKNNSGHIIFIKENKTVSVPCHGGKNVSPGTVAAIFKQAGINKSALRH